MRSYQLRKSVKPVFVGYRNVGFCSEATKALDVSPLIATLKPHSNGP